MKRQRAVVIQSETAGPVPFIDFPMMDAETEQAITKRQAERHPEMFLQAKLDAEQMRKEPLKIIIHEKGAQ